MTIPSNTTLSKISANTNNLLPSTTDGQDSKQTTSNVPDPIFIDTQKACRISADQLKRYSDPDELPTDTRTAPDLDVGFGQQRALKALHTALDIKASGYHVFADILDKVVFDGIVISV